MSNELQELSVLSLKNYNIKVCDKCLNEKPNFLCPNFLKCQFQKQYKANVVIHDYNDKKEILVFKDAFWQRGSTDINTNVDRTRKFLYDENGVLTPKDENEIYIHNEGVYSVKTNLVRNLSITVCINKDKLTKGKGTKDNPYVLESEVQE